MQARTLNRIAIFLMLLAPVIIMAGTYVGFIAHDAFSIRQQVAAHISILLAAITLKLSYIMHLEASKQLRLGGLAKPNPGASPPPPGASENHVHECCLTGPHRL